MNRKIIKAVDISERIGAVIGITSPAELLYIKYKTGENIVYPRGDKKYGRINENPLKRIRNKNNLKSLLEDLSSLSQIFSNSYLLLGKNDKRKGFASTVSYIAQLANSHKLKLGGDGADQVLLLSQLINANSRFLSEKSAENFIIAGNIHLTNSYFFAGIAKLCGRPWIDGSAVPSIVRTNSFGNKKFSNFINKFPYLGKILTWGTVFWEIAYPLTVVKDSKILSITPIVFHLANGPVMGLWRFVFAFGSLYPYRILVQNNKDLRRKNMQIYKYSFVSLSLFYIYKNLELQIYKSKNKIIFQQEEGFQYRTILADSGSENMIIFENGWGSVSEEWELIYNNFSDYDVYLIDRNCSQKKFNIDDYVINMDNFIKKISLQKKYKKIILVGHSFGGYILRNMALRNNSYNVYLIDPTVEYLLQQDVSGKNDLLNLKDHVILNNVCVKLGLGCLMNFPKSFVNLSRNSKITAYNRYRSNQFWSNNFKEWKFLDRISKLEMGELSNRKNIKIIVADKTLKNNPEILDYYKKMTNKDISVIDFSNHHTILMKEKFASDVSKIIKFGDSVE